VHDVDRAARRAAAEKRRARPLQDLDPLHAVQRMRDAAELIAVGETVAEDLGVEPADHKVVEIAERVLAADIDARRVVEAVTQHRAALLGQHFAGDDMDAAREVGKRRIRLAERRDGIRAVDAIALDRDAAGLRRTLDLNGREIDRAVALIGRPLLSPRRSRAEGCRY
jgi:hypothetical protein